MTTDQRARREARGRHPSNRGPDRPCVICGVRESAMRMRHTCATCRMSVMVPPAFVVRFTPCRRCEARPGEHCNDAQTERFTHNCRTDDAYEKLAATIPESQRPFAREVLTSRVAAAVARMLEG